MQRGSIVRGFVVGCVILACADPSHARTMQHAGPERGRPTTAPERLAAPPPRGFLELCERSPSECRESGEDDGRDDALIRREAGNAFWSETFGAPAATTPPAGSPQPAPGLGGTPGGEPSMDLVAPNGVVLTMSPERWAVVDRINQSVNRNIRAESDQAQYGQADYWNVQSGRDEHGDCEDYALTKRHQLIAAGVPAEVLSFGIVRTPSGEVHAILILTTDQGDMVLDNLEPMIVHWDQTGYRWIERQTPGRPFDWRRVG